MEKEEVIEELTKIYNQNGKINKNLIYEHGKTINKPLINLFKITIFQYL